MKRALPLLAVIALLACARLDASTLFRSDPSEYFTDYASYSQGCKVVAHAGLYPNVDPRFLTGWEEDGEIHGKRSLVFADKNQHEWFTVDLGQVRPCGKLVISTGLTDMPRVFERVTVYGSTTGPDGPWATLLENGDPTCRQTYMLDNPLARWLKFDFGENTRGTGSRVGGKFGVFKRYQLPGSVELIKAFYPKLRRDVSGLETFWKEIDAQRWEAAVSALRTYEEKRYLQIKGMIEDYWRDAKLALDDKLDYGGPQLQFRLGPDWTIEPPGSLDNPERGGPLAHVARAWSETGDARYAKKLVEWVNTWQEQLPRPPETVAAKYEMWATLGIAGRSAHWDQILSIIVKDRQNFSDQFFLNMMYTCWEHHDYLYHAGQENGNWLAAVTNGVLGAGLSWLEFTDAPGQIEWAKKNFITSVMRDVYSDGKEFENSDGYVVFAYGILLGTYHNLKQAGIKLPDEVERRMSLGTDWLSWITQPDGRTFMIGDSNGGDAVDVSIPREFNKQDQVYMLTRGKEGVKPPSSSRHFPVSGWFSMRSPWEEKPWDQARQLLMVAAPYGPHGGHDQLAIYCYAYGKPLLTVPSRFGDATYGMPELWETVYTWSKNTVVVDGKTQGFGYEAGLDRKCKNVKWFDGKYLDMADATHTLYPDVNHRRRVLFVNNEYWIVIDDMTLKPGADPNKSHSYDQLFHFKEGTDPVQLANGAVRTDYKNTGNLMLVPLSPEKLAASERISAPVNYIGCESPTMYGWKYRHEGKGSKRFVTVLYPYPKGKVPAVSVKKLDADPGVVAIEVTTPKGRDVIYAGDQANSYIYSKSLSAEARVFVAGMDAKGKPVRASGLDVREIKAGGRSYSGKTKPSVELGR